MNKKISYNEAIEELDTLIESMTSNEVDIDEVVNQVSRAKELIEICQERLSNVNTKVNEIVSSIENPKSSSSTSEQNEIEEPEESLF